MHCVICVSNECMLARIKWLTVQLFLLQSKTLVRLHSGVKPLQPHLVCYDQLLNGGKCLQSDRYDYRFSLLADFMTLLCSATATQCFSIYFVPIIVIFGHSGCGSFKVLAFKLYLSDKWWNDASLASQCSSEGGFCNFPLMILFESQSFLSL